MHTHTDSDDSPGVYLRDDFLGGPTELRAPTAERAALFLDAALAGRPQGGLEPAMIFTLHVYQYSLSRKGGGKFLSTFHKRVFFFFFYFEFLCVGIILNEKLNV